MVEYRHSTHAVQDIKYHLLWVTKHRYKVLRSCVAERARDVVIVGGVVSPDHRHILLSAPQQLSPAELVQYAIHNGEVVPAAARRIPRTREAVLRAAHGCFCATVGTGG